MPARTDGAAPEHPLERQGARALRDGRTLSSLIEEGLERVIAEKPKTEARTAPRLSDVIGGPLPGVDLSTNASVQDAEDREYAERAPRSAG